MMISADPSAMGFVGYSGLLVGILHGSLRLLRSEPLEALHQGRKLRLLLGKTPHVAAFCTSAAPTAIDMDTFFPGTRCPCVFP
jgi:hypothetical protein